MDNVSSQLRQILALECPEVSWPTARIEASMGWGDICNIDIHIAEPSKRRRDLEHKIRDVVEAQLGELQPRHSVRVLWSL